MKCEPPAELSATAPVVVEARNKADALRIETQRLLGELFEDPEALGDPTAEPPHVRDPRTLGD